MTAKNSDKKHKNKKTNKELSPVSKAFRWFRTSIKNQDDDNSEKNPEHSDNIKFVWGFIIACFSLCVLLALISHFFTGAEDQKLLSHPDLPATNWLGNSSTALMAVIISYSWMGFPYLMLMIVAGLQGIPKEYTEAARIDGANSIQVFFRITLPQLKGFLLILTLLEIISGFNSFDLIFTMTGGGPGVATETVGLNIYRMAFQNYDFGKASSMGILLLVLVMIGFVVYSLGQRRKARRWQG